MEKRLHSDGKDQRRMERTRAGKRKSKVNIGKENRLKKLRKEN